MANTTHGGFHSTALAAVNEALVVLGQDVTLAAADFAANSQVAHGRKAAFLYEGSRMRVLRDHAWSFALREVEAGCAFAPEDGGRFPYRLAVPGRCARLVACLAPDGGTAEWRMAGREIQAAEPVARVRYVADVEDLDKWSPDAYRALVLRLAADLAKPVTGRINERNLQEAAYADHLAAAKLNDAREQNVAVDAYGENFYVERMRGGACLKPPHFAPGHGGRPC